MEILVSILSLLIFTGLLFYFRHTDARNISVHSLQDLLKQSERRIESMLKQKEKEFNDKMIVSEIAIERMNRIAQVLQEKVNEFDKDMLQGQDLLMMLRSEIQGIEQELIEYKHIKTEFKDAEEKIGTILEMKQQAHESANALQMLKDSMNLFESDYKMFTSQLQEKSKHELTLFHQMMQKDLDKYLQHAREQIEFKDQEMSSKIQELGQATDSIAQRIKDFKDYIKVNLEQLQAQYDSDIEMAKTIAHTNLEDIFDMWTNLKEEIQLDKDTIEQGMRQKEEFFIEAQQKIEDNIEHAVSNMHVLVSDTQARFEHMLDDKMQAFDIQVNDIFYQLDQRGETAKQRIEQELEERTNSIRDELTKISSAFVEQEEMIEERFKNINHKNTEYLALEEQNFQNSIAELKEAVDNSTNYAHDILQEFHGQLEEKINQNLELVESGFREANHERLEKSIKDITTILEKEYKEKYQATIESMFADAEQLKISVEEKQKYVDYLEQRFHDINQMFDEEKEKIILMVQELEQDKNNSIQVISDRVSDHVQHINNEVQLVIQEFFDHGRQNFDQQNQIWQERYEEIVGEARDKYTGIQSKIDNVQHFLDEIKETSLTKLKDESDRLMHDAARRLEDFKHFTTDHIRGCKDDVQHQLDLARQEVHGLKEELWKQEKEVREIAQKDFERLNIRVKDVDKQFHTFAKKAEKLDKADEMISKLNQGCSEVNLLKKEIQDIIGTLKNSCYESKEVLQNMESFRNELDGKVVDLNIHTEEANKSREYLLNSINDVKSVASIFQQLEEEKEKAKNIEELLLKNLESFNDLQESLQVLQQRKEFVDEIINRLNDTEQGVSTLTSSADSLISKVQEISLFSDELQMKLGELQSEMRELAGDQTKIHAAVSRFNDLDHMIVHIDAEMKRLDKMREWIAKAMNNIHKADATLGFSKNNSDTSDDANIKNILRLRDQQWSVNDISKNLKVTPAYVELILERYRS